MQRISIDDPRWRAFVAGRPDAGPFHHPAWSSLLADCYGFSAFALVDADRAGAIRSGLPMIETGGRLKKRAWVSLPYSDYVAPLLRAPADSETFLAEVDRAWRKAGVGYLQVRGPVPGHEAYQYENDVIHKLRLEADPEALFARFHKMAARGVRKAEREGVTVREGDRPEDLTEVFYRLHLLTRRRQGSPVQPKRFFRLIWDRLIDARMGRVLIAYHGGEPIAATLFLSWNGTLVYKFSASTPATLKLRPNHLIIWRAIQDSCTNGLRVLDFGMSDRENAGLREFKSRWGAEETPLLYTILTEGSTAHQAGHAPRVIQTVIRRSPPVVCRAAGALLYRFAA